MGRANSRPTSHPSGRGPARAGPLRIFVTRRGPRGLFGQSTMPILVSHISEIAFAEMAPDGRDSMPELDRDLDIQDLDLLEPAPELEIALPGRW